MKARIQTRQVPLAELETWPANPRRGDIAAIRASLQRNGQYRAIVVRAKTMQVLAGNHTLLAMRELGWQRALCHLVDVDEDEARRIVLADNRTAELGGYDEQALADLLESLDGDFEGTGWDEVAVDALLRSLEPVGEPGRDTEPGEPPAEPRTKLGDLYVLGEHRLLCGDSTDLEAVTRLMDGAKAEMVFTDPPYGVDYDGGTKVREKLKGDDTTGLYDPACKMAATFSTPAASLYLWHAGVKGIAAAAAAAAAAAGYEIRCEIVWNKNQAQFGALSAQYKQKHEPCYYCFKRGQTVNWDGPTNEVTVWDVDRASVNEFHPTQKPIDLCERALGNHTAATVLDLFGGSGSTLIAAENRGVRAYLVELDPAYCDVIVDRWERHTGRKAKLA